MYLLPTSLFFRQIEDNELSREANFLASRKMCNKYIQAELRLITRAKLPEHKIEKDIIICRGWRLMYSYHFQLGFAKWDTFTRYGKGTILSWLIPLFQSEHYVPIEQSVEHA